jgi:hypothetical protein
MNCLTDLQIQAVVDREGAPEAIAHVESCARCQARVQERARLMASVGQAINLPLAIPPDLSRRVERALAESPVSGATRLRHDRAPAASWRRIAWSAGGVVAATVIGVLFVAPMVKGPSTVSAAEVLARSVSRLSQPVTSGVEFLEYELTLDGVPREMMPDHADGVYQVKQVIDHDTPGRYMVATYGPNGSLLSSVEQDPRTRRRIVTVLLGEQPFRFEFTVPDDVALSLPEMERLHMQASIAMMQASGNQLLQVVETPAGRHYRIEVPQVVSETPSSVWDLAEAQVVVDAGDYHVIEFAVKGTFLKQPYSVSYRLKTHAVDASVQPDAFVTPFDPKAIAIQGDGSAIPARDVTVAALLEVARMKQGR